MNLINGPVERMGKEGPEEKVVKEHGDKVIGNNRTDNYSPI